MADPQEDQVEDAVAEAEGATAKASEDEAKPVVGKKELTTESDQPQEQPAEVQDKATIDQTKTEPEVGITSDNTSKTEEVVIEKGKVGKDDEE